MAFASIAARNNGSQDTLATSHTINLPTGITSGSLLVVVFAYSVTGNTITWPGDWTPITNGAVEQTSGATEGIATGYRKADGGEGPTITITTSISTRSAHISLRAIDHADPATQAPEATATIGANGDADPPSLSPTGGAKDYLWIACGANSHAGIYSAAPANYSNLTVDDSGTTGAANSVVGTGERQLNAASEDPGAFTGSDPLAEWAAVTIAIHPGGGAPPPTKRHALTLLGVG